MLFRKSLVNTIIASASALGLSAALLLSIPSCNTTKGGFNAFTPEDDIELGKQVKQEIESNPQEYPILAEQSHPDAYNYLRNMTKKILNSGKVKYRNEFAWEVKIIRDDNTLNAFATPGGYIYVYTGLIKYLDTEDQLAGVLGHEIAHADQRHSTQQMTQIYGIAALTSIITGKSDPGTIEQIALGLLSLRFSRGHESEADDYSVVYLCGTEYNAAGAAGFFEKIEGQSRTPEFLSTHPDPGDRVSEIHAKANELRCKGTATNKNDYQRFKQMLP